MAKRTPCLTCGKPAAGSYCAQHRPPLVTLDAEYRRNRAALTAANRHLTTCPRCDRALTKRNPLTIDHIVPRAHGGGNHLDNLTVCCRICNSQGGAAILGN